MRNMILEGTPPFDMGGHQGRRMLFGYFSLYTPFLEDNTQLVQYDLANPNHVQAICFIVFGGHMNNLFIIEMKILVLIKWSYRSLQPCSLMSLEWLAYFEHV